MKVGEERIIYQGKTFEILTKSMKIGKKTVEIEIARRSPGVRLLIVKGKKILLTRELRAELKGYDYRLPGGKVFDTLAEYNSVLKSSKNILSHAIKAAKKECLEETGLEPLKMKHIHTSPPGMTVIWDLYYFLVSEFKVRKQKLGEGEIIQTKWFSFEDVKRMCIRGDIQEDRSVAVLLRFLLSSNKS